MTVIQHPPVFSTLSDDRFLSICHEVTQRRPLVHCLTNEVVQEITANVLLACGTSPAMVVGEGEVEQFASLSSAVLVNIGTPYTQRVDMMKKAAKVAVEKGIPWVLDPVAAGVIPWRDQIINELIALQPTVIRGNASEILALAGIGHGGQGVDSTDSSASAVTAAQSLARQHHVIVAVTGESDYVTDGEKTIRIPGGHEMATFVVGTGCSLSALVAAFCAADTNHLEATASALKVAKTAQEIAWKSAKRPGSFHVAYLDALYEIMFKR